MGVDFLDHLQNMVVKIFPTAESNFEEPMAGRFPNRPKCLAIPIKLIINNLYRAVGNRLSIGFRNSQGNTARASA